MKQWISKNRQMLLRGAGSLLAIGLLVFLIARRWDEIAAVIRQIPLWRFLLATLLVFISRFFVVGRWHVLASLSGSGYPILSLCRADVYRSVRLQFSSDHHRRGCGAFCRGGGDGLQQYAHPCIPGCRSVDRDGGYGNGAAIGFGCFLVHDDRQDGTGNFPVCAVGKRQGFRKENLTRRFRCGLRKPVSLLGALGMTWGHMLCTFASASVLLTGLNDPCPILDDCRPLEYFLFCDTYSNFNQRLWRSGISLTYLFA